MSWQAGTSAVHLTSHLAIFEFWAQLLHNTLSVWFLRMNNTLLGFLCAEHSTLTGLSPKAIRDPWPLQTLCSG